MGKKLLLSLWLTLCFAVVANAAKDRFTLVIDAGHGGNDAGAIGRISKEKNINLNVALAFGRYVENNCPDVRVIYTRKTDVFIPLHERANIANRNKADLFISIHTNALPKGRTARGLETYTLGMHRAADNFDVAKRENSVILIEKDYKQRYEGFDPRSSESYIMFEFMQDRNMEQSVVLAKAVQQRTCAAAGRPNKGVKQAGFLVLRETSMPSCLIELGFITTPDEEQYLNTKSGIDALGKGIYQAFLDYKNKYNKGASVQIKAQPEPIAEPAVKPERNRSKSNAASKTTNKKQTPVEQAQRSENKKSKRNSKNIIQELTDARNGTTTETQEIAETPQPTAPEITDKEAAVVVSSVENAATASTKPMRTLPLTALVPSTKATRSTETTETSVNTTSTRSAETADKTAIDTPSVPVFKVQILASSSNLAAGDRQLKGRTDISCYQENGLYKYTIGSSTDYNEIFRLRKSLLDTFPEAFIIAFKDGQKVYVVEAIREFKTNRTKRQTL